MKNATIETTLVAVTPVHRADDDSYWLSIDIPNGWDDVKKISRKVLSFEGRTYTFRGWNSDTLKCSFRADNNVARIVKR